MNLPHLIRRRLDSSASNRLSGWQLPNFELAAFVGLTPVWSWIKASTPLFYLCSTTLVAALILGGGTKGGFLSDSILQLIAIPLLLASLWRLSQQPLTKQMRLACWFCLAISLVPLAQLIPLPPWLWTALPNRQPSAEAFELLGSPIPWMPISVSPPATWLAALSVIPPLSIFLSTMVLTYHERRSLSFVIVAMGLIGTILGLLQIAQGQDSPLRFFKITNPEEAVGFFANRNHLAALLYCMIPIVAAWTLGQTTAMSIRKGEHASAYNLSSIVMVIVGFTALVIVLAGEIMTRSRAGLVLTIVALLVVILPSLSTRRLGRRLTIGHMIVAAAIAVAVVFSLQFGFTRMLERTQDSLQGARPIIALTTIEAAKAYMPVGAGLGTFVRVYAMFEKPEQVSLFYTNRAHNDILELWLETGVVGLGMMVVFAIWLARRSWAIWRSRRPMQASDLDWSLTRAATIIVTLLVAHSLFDYPLRTSAMASIFAFACALMIEPLVGLRAIEEPQLGTSARGPTFTNTHLKSGSPTRASGDLQVAPDRIGKADTPTVAPSVPTPSPQLSEGSRAKLQEQLGRIDQTERGGGMPPEITPPDTLASPMPHGSIETSETPDAATPSGVATRTVQSLPPQRRWGNDMEWPEAWSQSTVDSAKKQDRKASPKRQDD